jgi:hypothetical protein
MSLCLLDMMDMLQSIMFGFKRIIEPNIIQDLVAG